jgi:hypothetical protein
MIISIINRSKKITDAQTQTVVRAINRQIAEDFAPYWSFSAQLRLEGTIGVYVEDKLLSDMRGDAVLYLIDEADESKAFGWHYQNYRDLPYGFVFLDLCKQYGEDWSVTLSHESLELLGDPLTNLLVQGPSPKDAKLAVFHSFEMCDAVQNESYVVDGVRVSNFVLPSYFSVGEQEGKRNDFLGTKTKGKTLASFGINPGGYISYFNPATGKWEQHFGAKDAVAKKRIAAKKAAKAGRGIRRASR